MSKKKIHFHEDQSSFNPANRPQDKNYWFDTSFSQSPRAIGRLRLPGADNGNYEYKHPILDKHGTTVGFTAGSVSLGYTYTCVSVGGCFWIANQFLGPNSMVSLLDATGTFWFSTKAKFKVVKEFTFSGTWASFIEAFKLLDGGAYLFYLTKLGVCLFDTRMRKIIAMVEFKDFAFQWTDFALSPKVKLLAFGCSKSGDKSLLDGEYRYNNFIRIYNLETGVLVGEQALPGEQHTHWTVDFSEDGHQLRVASKASTHVFELIERR